MKSSWCLAAVALSGCALAGCAVHTATRPFPSTGRAARTAPKVIRVRVVENGRWSVKAVPLEKYVHAAIISEVAPPSGDAAAVGRMLEVQAILSRTYAIAHLDRHKRDGYDLCATTHCQLFEPARLRTSRWATAGADAVRHTRSVVLWFDAAPAAALFHADCGGHTSTPAAVWGGTPHSYLAPLADDGPAASAHTTWRYETTRDALRRALNADARTAPGSRLDDLVIVNRDPAGRAAEVRIRGERTRDVKGEVLRDVLTRAFGVRTIKSTWLDVRRQRSSYIFEGRGFGHGVGLCQAGAQARLSAGASPAAVLSRYFPGTRLVTLN
jgi:stage II sporulation protein D